MEGRKSATVKDRSGGTYKAPVFMVSDKKLKENLLTRLILGWRGRERPSHDKSE